jgi:hypothetical protein
MPELLCFGVLTFTQNEKSTVIFVTPRDAIKLDAFKKTGNPDELVIWLNASFLLYEK